MVRTLESIDLHPEVTFLVGENGSGKSTLLEAIAIALEFNPEGGSRNFDFGTRDVAFRPARYLRIAHWLPAVTRDGFFLRAPRAASMSPPSSTTWASPGPSYGGSSLHEQSHGESFLALLKNRFRPQGLYLLAQALQCPRSGARGDSAASGSSSR